MNKSQKHVSAIFIPIVILVLTFGVANTMLDGKATCTTISGVTRNARNPNCVFDGGGTYHSGDIEALEFNKTWWLWLIALGIIGVSEFNLFEDKKKADK